MLNAGFYNYDTATSEVIDPEAFAEHADINTHGDDSHFVQFYNGASTEEQTKELYTELFNRHIIGPDMLTMRVEALTYSHDASIGNLIRLDITQSNSGQYYSEVSYLNFAPTHNGSATEQRWIRASMQITFLVCVCMQLWNVLQTFRAKGRQLMNYRVNEFDFTDAAQVGLVINGIIILFSGGMLLYGSDYDYEAQFRLPLSSYDQFDLWVQNCELVKSFRLWVAIFVVNQMINLLLIASTFLPNLGIVFLTLKASIADMITFSTICWLLFSVFTTICFVSFGEHSVRFNTLMNSYITVFQMFLGELPYSEMYHADPVVSAMVLVAFVVLMNFLILNMYTAIVIRTYNKL